MKRPWFSLGLLMFLCSFSYYTGMNVVFIPLFVLFFVLFPKNKVLFLLPFLLFRLLLLPNPSLEQVEGEFRIQAESPLAKEVRLEYRGESYLLSSTKYKNGLYRGVLRIVPFSKKRSPSGFSPRDFYHAKGYLAETEIVEAELLEEKDNPLFKLRRSLYERTKVYGEQAGTLYSLLFGVKDGLEKEEKQLFSELGLLHLFVVSGLHLGIYARTVKGLVSRLRAPYILGEVLSYVLMLLLCMVSNFHVSTLRSIGIYGLGSLAFYKREKLDVLEAMGCVSFFLLLYRPSYATSFSFLLGTFAYGILRMAKTKQLFWMYLLMLPFQLLFMPQIKFSAYLLNSLLSVLMLGILPFLMLTTLFSFLAPLGIMLLHGLLYILTLFQQIPFSWSITPLGWVCFLLFYVAILFCQWMKEEETIYRFMKKKRVKVIFLLLLFFLHGIESDVRKQGVHFLDVGQGDSSLIITQAGSSILIDTGKGKSIHQLLHHLGVVELDVLIITHFDEDHCGQIENLRYKKLYYPKGSDYAGGLPLERGDVLYVDEVVMRVVSPDKLQGEDNEDSLVIYVEAYEHRFFYGGDVGKRTLSELQAEKVHILKFPHHGSKHSLDEAFMDGLSTELMILSYGKNRYGHPHQEVLDYGEGRGILLFKTMEEGNLQIKKNGMRGY